jgi:formate C-acetyltransferase
MDNLNNWRNFKGNDWKNCINVSDFIANNYTEYTGDDSFLSEATAKTKAVWSRCEELLKEESKKGGCLDVETKILSKANNKIPFVNNAMSAKIPYPP